MAAEHFVVLFFGFCGLLLAAALYFLPLIVAYRRRHHQVVSIGLLNLFLGWTFLGWVIALVWSASALRRSESRSDAA